jgi:SAM-dependent methyltransferase
VVHPSSGKRFDHLSIVAAVMAPAERYVSKAVDPHSSHTRVARILDAALTDRSAPRILDIGAAGGLLRTAALRHGLRVAEHAHWVAVDRDPAVLDAAALAGIEVHALDVASDAPPPGPFDAVVFADVLEHLPAPHQILRRWLPLVCGPRTLVVASLPNVANVAVRLGLLFGQFEYAQRGILDRDHLRFYTRRSARRMLEDAGIVVEQVWTTPVPLYLLAEGRFAENPIVTGLQASLYAITRLVPTLLGYQFVFAGRHTGHA